MGKYLLTLQALTYRVNKQWNRGGQPIWLRHGLLAAIPVALSQVWPFFARKGVIYMRAPVWLDDVIGDLREVGSIAHAIANCSRLRQAIETGIKAGKEWEERKKENPKLVGTSFEQEVRVAIIEAFNSPN